MEVAVVHDSTKHHFSCLVDGAECVMEYDLMDNVADLYRTFVPEALRGRGLAERLMSAFIEFVSVNNMKVIPSCSYAVHYFKRHKEYQHLLQEGVNLENEGTCRIRK